MKKRKQGRPVKAPSHHIKLLADEGFTRKKIANILGYSQSGINCRVLKEGIKTVRGYDQREYHQQTKISYDCLESFAKEGFTQSQVARMCGCTKQLISLKAIKGGIKLKDGRKGRRFKHDDKIKTLWSRGFTSKEMAEKLKLHPGTVNKLLNVLGLKHHPQHNVSRMIGNISYLVYKGYSVAEIAEELRTYGSVISRYISKYGLKKNDGRSLVKL